MCRGQSVGSYEQAGEVSHMELQRGHEDLYRKEPKGHSSYRFFRQHFFSERVINTWNHLDAAVIEAGIINTFKSRLQKLHDKDESVFGRYPFS